MKGQGAVSNVKNKFESQEVFAAWQDEWEPDDKKHKTELRPIVSKTIVNEVKSTDLPFIYSLNPYQGCEHGCSYCFARPTHEYWSLNAGVDFERKILYKPDAAKLLEALFRKKTYKPSTISISGNTDCYQPAERKLELTRKILEVCVKYKHPIGIITKNALLLRDLDLLQELQKDKLISVALSITTLDETLRQKLEPRTSSIANRLKAMQVLSEHNIPVIGMMAPIIPGLNSHEILKMAEAFKNHGANGFSYALVRLNDSVEPIFSEWAHTHYPDRASKILNQIKETHQGKLGSKTPMERMRGTGAYAETIRQEAALAKLKYFPDFCFPKLSTEAFEKNRNPQLSLF